MSTNKTPFFKKIPNMSKNNISFGNSVFGQLISLMPKQKIRMIIKESGTDRYTKRFTTWDHLIVMLFSAFEVSNSLRELESGIVGFMQKLLHLGMSSFPKRSTLSDANAKRNSEVFEKIFNAIYEHVRPFLPDSWPKNQQWMEKLFLVDSTTITLFKEIMKSAGRTPANGKRKGGVKIHVGMHLSESVPSLVRITSAASSDKQFMHKFKNMEQDTILVFDKAYVNYKLYNHWSKTGVSFVTRLPSYSVVKVKEEKMVDEKNQAEGIYREQLIELGHKTQKEKVLCRLIFLHDIEKNRDIKFITNNMKLESAQIAEIYKQRWQIELLFKRLKQNLQLSDFLGDNENAIRIQIWCNLIADLLLTVIRKGLKKKKAYSNVAGLIRIHLMSYVKIKDLLSTPGNPSIFSSNSDLSPYQTSLKLPIPP